MNDASFIDPRILQSPAWWPCRPVLVCRRLDASGARSGAHGFCVAGWRASPCGSDVARRRSSPSSSSRSKANRKTCRPSGFVADDDNRGALTWPAGLPPDTRPGPGYNQGTRQEVSGGKFRRISLPHRRSPVSNIGRETMAILLGVLASASFLEKVSLLVVGAALTGSSFPSSSSVWIKPGSSSRRYSKLGSPGASSSRRESSVLARPGKSGAAAPAACSANLLRQPLRRIPSCVGQLR